MVYLLIRLISRLSEAIAAWDEFSQNDIGYFLDDESPSLKPSITAVHRAFAQLKAILLNLERLKKELLDDNAAVSHLLSLVVMAIYIYLFEKIEANLARAIPNYTWKAAKPQYFSRERRGILKSLLPLLS